MRGSYSRRPYSAWVSRSGPYSRKRSRTSYSTRAVVPRQKLTAMMKRAANRGREIKYADWVNAPTRQVNTYSSFDLCNISQGTTDVSRVGDKLEWMDLSCKFNVFTGTATAAPVVSRVRVLLIQWHGDDSTDPVTPATLFTSTDPLSQYTYDYVTGGKFKVLFDKEWMVDNVGTTPQTYECTIPHTAGRQKIGYNGGGNTGHSHIYYIAISDTAGATAPFIGYSFRFRYRDA